MKHLLIMISCFFISMSLASAQKAKAQALYSEKQVQVIKNKISKQNLKSIFDKKGLDAANEVFFDVVVDFAKRAKALAKKSKTQRTDILQADSDKELLIYIVNRAQDFTDDIDGGLIHFYGLSKLYEVVQKDFDWAIDRSGLTANDRAHMRDALKAQLEGDY